jgi:hypothetical protein
VSALQFFRRIDESIFRRLVEMEPAFEKVYDASKQWLERDDH